MRHTEKQQYEISEICEIKLGGYLQKILIEGTKKSNPVVICLHGGPGSPIPFNVGSRGLFPEIKEYFTLVCWDQLGCGINNRVIDDSFHIDDFEKMTLELISYIHSRFEHNRIYLFGMSWGSLLTLKAASGSEYVDGAVCNGQVLHNETFNDEVFTTLEKSRMPECKKKQLETYKNDINAQNAKKIMGFVNRYTDGYFCRSKHDKTEKLPVFKIIKGMLSSPDYRFRDLKAVVINGYAKNNTLIEEFVRQDVRPLLSNIKIPYTIVQGSTDIVTPTAFVKQFIKTNKNKNVRLIVIENCGHFPDARVNRTCIEQLKVLDRQCRG
ncbi:MAG: alpha/beta hydrolase [Oscillospiraceae bacterium]|nr:alpha/beta hydrolase [Oscillospiraceae bacterium]